MTTPFIGEIQLFGFSFPPRGWAYCRGSLLSIAQNTALFSLLGTTYGGNGQTTFALPNLSGRAAGGLGQGPGLSPRTLGEAYGASTVTLTSSQMPAHTHAVSVYAQANTSRRAGTPATNSALSSPSASTSTPFRAGTAPDTTFAPGMLSMAAGSGFPHENQQPYLALNFSIALQGIFPSRN